MATGVTSVWVDGSNGNSRSPLLLKELGAPRSDGFSVGDGVGSTTHAPANKATASKPANAFTTVTPLQFSSHLSTLYDDSTVPSVSF